MYIDAFAGAGLHISKTTGEYVLGSPTNALLVVPKFKEYHLIDLNSKKASELRSITEGMKEVKVYDEDCNKVLMDRVFPLAKYEDYRRALCILDPYGLHLNWDVILEAGRMRSVDIFLNFPIMDINMNVLHRNPENVNSEQVARLNAFWGDDSWKEVAYQLRPTLFGDAPEKVRNDVIVEAFRVRLKKVAGFEYVPKPLAMRNRSNATVYYLYFASPKVVANNIIKDIFDRYKQYSY